jgi:hypothetical protein
VGAARGRSSLGFIFLIIILYVVPPVPRTRSQGPRGKKGVRASPPNFPTSLLTGVGTSTTHITEAAASRNSSTQASSCIGSARTAASLSEAPIARPRHTRRQGSRAGQTRGAALRSTRSGAYAEHNRRLRRTDGGG